MNIKKIHEQLGIDNQPFSIRKIHENIAYEQAQREWDETWKYATTPIETTPSAYELNTLGYKNQVTFNPVYVEGTEVPEGAKVVTQEQFDAINEAREKIRQYYTSGAYDAEKEYKAAKKAREEYDEKWFIDPSKILESEFMAGDSGVDVRTRENLKQAAEKYYQLKYNTDADLTSIYNSLADKGGNEDSEAMKKALYGNTDIDDYIVGNVFGGLGSVSAGFTDTLDAIVGTPLKWVGWENNPISEWNEATKEATGNLQQKGADVGYSWGDKENWGGRLIQGVAAIAPDTILAIWTGGLSKGFTSASLRNAARAGTSAARTTAFTKALVQDGFPSPLATVATKSKALSTAIGTTVKNLAKSPMYWSSFARSFGSDYFQAKENGASDAAAYTYALINSTAVSLVEQGGIQALPSKLMNKSKSQLLKWAVSAIEEGEEEVIQGLITEMNSKVSHAPDKTLGEIFDPARMLEEFAMGTAIGGIAGGGQVIASNIANPTPKTAKIQKQPEYKGIKELSAAPDKKDAFQKAMEKAGGYETLSQDQKALQTLGQILGVKVKFANLDVKREDGSLFSPDGQYDKDTNTITLNTSEEIKHNPVAFVLKHEITHSLENLAPEQYADLSASILNSNLFKDWVQAEKGFETIEEYRADIMRRYTEQGVKGFKGQEGQINASKEMVANFVGDVLFGGRDDIAVKLINGMAPKQKKTFIEWVKDIFKTLRQKFSGNVTMAEEIDRLENLFLDAARETKSVRQNKSAQTETTVEEKTETEKAPEKDKTETKEEVKPEKEVEQTAEEKAEQQKTTTEEGSGVKYSIAYTTNNKPVLVVNDDILKNATNNKEKVAIVKQSLGRFKKVPIKGQTIHFIADTKQEYTSSKYSRWLSKNDQTIFDDKMRVAAHPQDIVYATTDYINESLNHSRKDNIVDFARGTLLIDVAGRQYESEVVIGFTKSGICELHDIVNLTPTKFEYKKETVSKGIDSNESTRSDTTSKNSIPNSSESVKENLEKVNVGIDEKTESASPLSYSLASWEQSDYVDNRNTAAKELAKALGITQKKAKEYIDSINSIAKVIADGRTRLDYVAAKGRSTFVSNAEYGGSVDCSTLCPKRKILTGTFSAVQKALKNSALTAEEVLDIRNRMKEKGLEVSCGLCYVEGSRAQMGKFSKEFIERYKKTNPEYVPDMFDVNTPEGVEQLRIDHPEAYEAYEKFWNNKGVLNEGDSVLFASQQKPKLYQTRTDYKGEILNKFKSEGNVVEKNKNGGLRLQSFSDFEIVHLIDMMQVVMDMSRVGLAGQAYTKVPDFALALGNTGLKINLSLIAKGVDADGKLIFDDVEGMPIDTATRIRDMYSDNVGTILVVFNDAQLKAALADDRVDFIIPFHRSQWKKALYEKLGLPKGTKDYTYQQNEKYIKPVYYTTRNGTIGTRRATNYMPNEYWDFGKSGKKNAEAYLKMCAENNKRPKFYKLLVDNKDGSYSLQPDGSTDGYWKLLIDFKMYNNEGVGVPQQPVKPDFNMVESIRMLEEYKGGHQQFPVDQETVDEFVKDYKAKHKMDDFVENEATESKAPDNPYKGFSYSLPESDQEVLLKQFENGELTREEYLEAVKRAPKGEKVLNPVEIANLTPEDADTTPDLKPKEDRSIAPVQALARKKLGVEGGDRIAAMIEDFGGQPRSDLIDVANNILENLPDKPDTRNKEDKLLLARRIRETEESLNKAIKKVKKDYGTRKSWESFSESDIITDEVKDLIAKDGYIQNYGRTTNKRTLGKALELLEEEGRERVEKFMKMPPEEANAVDVAVGLILLERYQRAGKFTSAQAVAQKLSEIGTISGQTVQIFSVIGRFSPEMMVQYAQRELDKAFEILVENKTKAWVDKHAEEFQLTPEDIDFIKNCTIVASQLEDGSRMKAVLLAQASQRVSDKIPPSAGDSIRAFQRISLLLNARTFLRNLLGNVSMIPAYVSSDFFGNLIDKQLAKKSNIRTTGNVRLGDKDLGRAFWKGAVESWDDFKRGIRTRQEELNRFDVNVKQGKAFNENHEKLKILNGFSRAANALDNFTSFTLELGDRTFFEMWLVNSLKNQMTLNKTDTPTAEMLEIAKQEALQRTWQDNNRFTRSLMGFKEKMNDFIHIPGTNYGLGDVVLKFVKTPANIAKAIIDFSPIGGIKAIANARRYMIALEKGNLTPAMQKEFVRTASNAITGTLFYILIAVLANAGVLKLSGAGDEDKDVANFEKYVAGVHPYSMKIGGVWVPYEWNQPIGAVLAAVADIMENTDYEHTNPGDYASDAINAMRAGLTVFSEQSFLKNFAELFSKEDVWIGLVSAAAEEPAAFIPQVFSQIASFTDPYRRTTYVSKDPIATALNGVMNRIPGLRQMLPEQVNVLGEEAENTQFLNPWLAFASPYNLYPKVSGEVASELYELYKDTSDNGVIPPVVANKFTIKGVEVVFDPEEKAKLQNKVGKLSADILEEMFDSDEYKKLDDEQKIKAVKAVYSYATDKAKTELDIFDYDLVKEMEGKKSNGEYILTKNRWNRIGRKGQQILIDEYFLTKKQRATKGDTKKLAEMFIESAADK